MRSCMRRLGSRLARGLGRGLRGGLGAVLGLSILGSLAAAAEGVQMEKPGKVGLLPTISLQRYIDMGTDSLDAWAKASRASAGDRAALFRNVRHALEFQARYAEKIGTTTYPKEQLEWLLITDAVADTFVTRLEPLVQAYEKAVPNELLTEGRQAFELVLGQIPGAPARMLGFHVVMLARWAYTQTDSLNLRSGVQDQAGMQDAVLRYLREWSHLYGVVHADPIKVYESRISQEDWIISRIRNNCGTTKWALREQFMASIMDSSTTPPTERFAHEFHINAVGCDDQRVIYVDLPNFHEVQLEVYRQEQQNKVDEAIRSRR